MTKELRAAAAIFFASVLYFCKNFELARLWIFQERDLLRAEQLLHGNLIFYGPETTGGGHLFGPLYYYLLAIPALLGSPLFGAWCLMIALSACAAVLIWIYLKRNVNVSVATLGAVLFLLSDWHVKILGAFYNPSYLPLFQVACTLLICETFLSAKANARAWFFALFTIGLGSQIHATILIMIPAGILLQLLAPYLQLPRLSARQFIAGFIGVLIPIIPYLIWSAAAGDTLWGHSPDGRIADALVAMNTIVQTPSSGITAKFWMVVFFSILYIPTLLMLVVPIGLWSRLSGKLRGGDPGFKLIKILAVQALAAYPLIVYYAFAYNAHRYQGPFTVSIALLSALVFEREVKTRRQLIVFAGFALAVTTGFLIFEHGWVDNLRFELIVPFVALLIGVVVSFERLTFSSWRAAVVIVLAVVLALIQSNTMSTFGFAMQDTKSPLGRIGQYLAISKSIYERTGWSFEEARQRIYFINPHHEHSMAYAYRDVIQKSAPVSPSAAIPSGFFAAVDCPKSLSGQPTEEFTRWILAQNLSNDVRRWIESGELALGDPVDVQTPRENYFLLPYRSSLTNEVPPFVQNIGYQYVRYPDADKIENHTEHRGVLTEPNGDIIFYWNECPLHQRSCSTGAIVRVSPLQGDKIEVQVRILGQSLSHLSEWISPRWTEEWNGPFIELQCGAKNMRFVLAENIGRSAKFSTRKRGNMVMTSNSLLAPFVKNLNIKCPEGIREMRMGRKSSTITDTNLLDSFILEVPELKKTLVP